MLASGQFVFKSSTKVSPSEVLEAIKPPTFDNTAPLASGKSSTSPDSNMLPGIKMPFQLQKQFNDPANLNVLKGWLDTTPKEYRQEFLDELVAVVEEAKKTNAEVNEAINNYHKIKITKIEEENNNKSEHDKLMLNYLAVAFGCAALIALFSLILVLLAIERNTREKKL